jgi:hypothetical protein
VSVKEPGLFLIKLGDQSEGEIQPVGVTHGDAPRYGFVYFYIALHACFNAESFCRGHSGYVGGCPIPLAPKRRPEQDTADDQDLSRSSPSRSK